MKKQITKIISVVLIFVISALVLSSCAYIDAYVKEHIIQPRPENKMYGAVKALYSYEDVMDALAIVREKHEVSPRYTVDDMGEGYTVVYHFINPGRTVEYPIDYDTYFNEMSFGGFNTFIVLEDQECPGHTNTGDCPQNDLIVNKYDEDYEKITDLRSHALVELKHNHNTFVEIENRDLLSYKDIGGNKYQIFYEDTNILELESFIELDEDFFELFFDRLVTTAG